MMCKPAITMKHMLLLIFNPVFILMVACASQETIVEKQQEEISLEGTWRLVKTIEIGHEDITNRMDSDQKMYMKHINETHWTWSEYDYASNQLLGAGGGTYTLEGNTYTEDIKFYFPPGSNELGQAIPFTIELTDSLWRITGYVKMMEFDPETGENVASDSAIIDEYWERVDIEPTDETGGALYGTWNLVSYKQPTDVVWEQYPDFVGYTKLLTPTHWVFMKYNKEADELMAIGGGTYSVQGDQYMEKVDFVHGARSSPGSTTTFQWQMLDSGNWQINGTINGSDGSTFEIDEIWERHGAGIALNQ